MSEPRAEIDTTPDDEPYRYDASGQVFFDPARRRVGNTAVGTPQKRAIRFRKRREISTTICRA